MVAAKPAKTWFLVTSIEAFYYKIGPCFPKTGVLSRAIIRHSHDQNSQREC
jgi:hypothetical protein